MSQAQRMAHRVGLLLAAPIPILTGIAFVWWLRGEFPPTVRIDDVSIILGIAAGATILVYLLCRAVGWAAAAMLA
jgi:hypothetical protein